MLIAIDPGQRSGFALFDDKGKLMRAFAAPPMIIKAHLTEQTGHDVVVEIPWNRHDARIDVNDLIGLAVLAGEYGAYGGTRTAYVYPHTWKGNVPKTIHNLRVLKKLSTGELSVLKKRPRAKSFDHNMVDAIGLGLWWLEGKGKRKCKTSRSLTRKLQG